MPRPLQRRHTPRPRCTQPYCTRPGVVSYDLQFRPRQYLCVLHLSEWVNRLPGQPIPRLRIEAVELPQIQKGG